MLASRNIPTECLLNNIIDEDFQAMLRPLSIYQKLFLIAKFRINNNFITPKNNLTNYIASMFAVTILIGCFVFRFVYYYKSVEEFANPVISFLLYFDFVFYTVSSIVIYISGAFHSSSSVELIIKAQSVLQFIKIDKKTFLFKLKTENWISIVSIVIMYAAYCFVPTISYSGIVAFLINLVLSVPTMFFDMEMIIVTRIVVLIKTELDAWNHVMEKYQKGNIKNEEETRYDEWSENDMYDAYVNIIRAFCLCNKVFQISFTLFAFQTFIHILANLELVLEFGKLGNKYSIFQSLLSVKLPIAIWNLKNILLIVTLSIACENFYGSVKMAESSCAQILKDCRVVGVRRTCKNVLRLSRSARRKLSACGVFEVDATLPLRLLAALLAYTVVLLQFAFL